MDHRPYHRVLHRCHAVLAAAGDLGSGVDKACCPTPNITQSGPPMLTTFLFVRLYFLPSFFDRV